MRVKYFGHASFLLVSNEGRRIITDPYHPGYGLKYGVITDEADIVTVSHEHNDHNNASAIKGNPIILKDVAVRNVRGLEIKSIPVYHDEDNGTKRGNNLIFCFNLDGLDVCHLGDLGHPLENEQLKQIGHIDILMIPVGGYFTIDAKIASAVAESLDPRIIIPMHFKTAKADFPIKPVDDFLAGKKDVRRLESSEIEFRNNTLPRDTEIIVLKSAN